MAWNRLQSTGHGETMEKSIDKNAYFKAFDRINIIQWEHGDRSRSN